MIEPPGADVLGYYTLSASIVDVTDIAAELASKLPRYPQLPVTLIGRLAVDERLIPKRIQSYRKIRSP